MNHVVADPAIRSRLFNLEEPVEIRDESGRTLGYFTPLGRHAHYVGAESPLDDEELRRREEEAQGGKGYSTMQVLDYLKKL